MRYAVLAHGVFFIRMQSIFRKRCFAVSPVEIQPSLAKICKACYNVCKTE